MYTIASLLKGILYLMRSFYLGLLRIAPY